MNDLTATASITMSASAEKVWAALTNPEMVKQFMFGSNVTSDWQVGSPITYAGEWEGKTYEDRGVILESQPGVVLKCTYFSDMSGLEDKPENYNVITYALSENDGQTTLQITQENNKSAQAVEQSTTNWNMILQTMKGLIERS